jgi:hypothetical protein
MSIRTAFILAVAVLVFIAGYGLVVTFWSYSSGERAGWVQKFSSKGWFCKTWEGEMAMVSMPGTTTEKFFFTVWDDDVAAQINKVMGKRVSLHYEEKVGIPTSCFGETRHYVTKVTAVEEIPLAPGVVVPTKPAEPAPPAAPAPTAPAAAAPAPAAPAAPAASATPEKK